MAGTDDEGGPDPAAKPKPARARKAPASGSGDADKMVAEIERTREELAETLDAIADKVSPKRVAKRTTKKVASAVKETAHDAATAVKDTAHDAAASVKDTAVHAKAKVTGGGDKPVETAPDLTLAPDPGLDGPTAQTTHLAPSPYLAPPPVPGSMFKPEYVAAGVAAALVAWLLLRRRS